MRNSWNLLLTVVFFAAFVGAKPEPDNVLLGCKRVREGNSSYVCLPVPSNARVCRFPLECAELFLLLQPVDAMLWQPLFQTDGNETICSELGDFRAEISGAALSSPTNDTMFVAEDWRWCGSYRSCMYQYLDLIEQFVGVLFRAANHAR